MAGESRMFLQEAPLQHRGLLLFTAGGGLRQYPAQGAEQTIMSWNHAQPRRESIQVRCPGVVSRPPQ